MFIPFLFHLRALGLKVTLHEWHTLLLALEKGHADQSLTRFYYLARAITCRSEVDFDTFDLAFISFFEGLDGNLDRMPELFQKLLDWLKEPLPKGLLSPEEKAALTSLDWEELHRKFKERLEEQKERHDGGNKWIGTGGTSPFGHSGQNPRGIRVGGESSQGSAVQIAAQRRFINFRSDLILDVRQIGLALRRLSHWVRDGHRIELDLEGSVKATAVNAGELEIVFRPEEKNDVKLLLLMDVGGSMTYHSAVCEELFSAAHQSTHFKAFEHFYFHNCPYDDLFRDVENVVRIGTKDVLKKFDSSWMLIILGDAAMAPSELTEVGGAIDYEERNLEPGLRWLERIRRHFPISVWLNPEPKSYWGRPSNRLIRSVFQDMFPMTLEGLDEAISCLKRLKAGRSH